MTRTCSNSGSGVLIAMVTETVKWLSRRAESDSQEGVGRNQTRQSSRESNLLCTGLVQTARVSYVCDKCDSRVDTVQSLLGTQSFGETNVETRHRTRCLQATCRSRRKNQSPQPSLRTAQQARTCRAGRERNASMDRTGRWALLTPLPFKG